MDKEKVIINLSQQLEEVARRIGSLAADVWTMNDGAPEIADTYETFLFDEVAHLQMLTISVTKAVTDGEEVNGDESIFGPGELMSEFVDKEEPEKDEEPPEEEDE